MLRIYTLLVVGINILLTRVQAEPSVHILAENLNQLVTSTTLQWIPNDGNEESLLENAVVAAYQIMEPEQKDTEDEINSVSSKPVYVCRARINSIWVSGQLRPKKPVCVVSLYKKVIEFKQFDVLINIEGSARLSWVHKNKYTFISQGAVTSGENILRNFIARRAAKSHNKEGSLTYYIGKFNPSDNLGTFTLVDQNDNEIEFEEGEILVETEPIRYELKSLKFGRPRHVKKPMVLGQATLKNEEENPQRVDSVISYNYTYSIFWGKGHGLLTGLPFSIHLSNGEQAKGAWAISNTSERVDLAPIERILEQGTAVNVTLIGNYTESDVPYIATVVSFYRDNEKKETIIRDNKREYHMLNVVAQFGPVYFLHNNSHVPTTTTTTTTTTSTTTTSTTTKTTSTTQEVTPIATPEVVIIRKKGNELDVGQHKKSDNNSMQSDGGNVEDDDPLSLKKKDSESYKANSAEAFVAMSLAALLGISSVLRRLT